MAGDWVRYWRARSLPLEAMHARFTTHVYHRHSHESYSIGITEAGTQEFRCRHGHHVSGPGMVMLFNPDDPHDGNAADAAGFTYRMVHVGPDLMAGLVGEVTGQAAGLPLFLAPVAGDPALARALLRLAATLEPRGGADGELARYERLADVTRHVARHASGRIIAAGESAATSMTTVPAGVAARLRDLIHDAGIVSPPGGPPLTMDDLAVAAGCSRYAAYRAFRAAFGMAPSDYQRQLRIRAARRMLAEGSAPAIAAAQAGFADQAHLTRWFRRYYGITPAAYQAAVALAVAGPGADVGEPAPAQQQRAGSQPEPERGPHAGQADPVPARRGHRHRGEAGDGDHHGAAHRHVVADAQDQPVQHEGQRRQGLGRGRGDQPDHRGVPDRRVGGERVGGA
jgi:AraC-like DNA-binding protein